MNKSNNKNELRRSCRALRDGFGEEFIERVSACACKNLMKSNEFVNADTVLLYFPVKNEISPLPIFEFALTLGKKVAFPVCNKENNTLVFRRVTNLNQFTRSSFGPFEPNDECKEVTPNERTLCIVPALLFSKNGYRIGYGGGYYDRFLLNFTGTSVGFIYSELLCDNLAPEAHDIPVNMIITESEVLYIA